MSRPGDEQGRPLNLSQVEVDNLTAGDRKAARGLARRLNTEVPSEPAATGRRRDDKVGPVDVTAAQLRALAKDGRTRTPSKVARALEEAEKAAGRLEGRLRRRAEKKDEPTTKPPDSSPPASVVAE